MTDHSLRGYLERRTTEELDAILAYCLQDDNYKSYEYVIKEIISILLERDLQDTDLTQ